jgi:hypothetical protein
MVLRMNVTVFPLLLLQLRRNEAVMGFSCSSDTRHEKCLYNVDGICWKLGSWKTEIVGYY